MFHSFTDGSGPIRIAGRGTSNCTSTRVTIASVSANVGGAGAAPAGAAPTPGAAAATAARSRGLGHTYFTPTTHSGITSPLCSSTNTQPSP